MSDYISKQAVLEIVNKEIERVTNSYDHNTQLRILFAIKDLSTVDEKEIIRKPMERIKERIDEKMESIDYWTKPFDKYEYYDNGFWEGMNEVATIVEEEGGTSEM